MKKLNKKYYFIIFGIVILIIIIIFLYNKQERPISKTTTAMGTYINQTICGKKASDVAIQANNCIKQLEDKISWRISSSEIALINKSKGQKIHLSKETIDILRLSLDVAQASNGAFDPTILPISRLWDFGGDHEHVPSNEEIKRNLHLVNYKNICIHNQENNLSLKNKSSEIDLGAVGKGSACNAALSIYKESKIKYGIISVGGSIGIFGHKYANSPFKIGIRNPFSSSDVYKNFAIINVQSGCISTSGPYEKNFTSNNVFYHHILNPKTGYPVSNNTMSVTVLHENGTLTDLLSTACYILDKNSALNLLKHYNAEGILVDKEKKVFATQNIIKKINLICQDFSLIPWQ